jgi:hydroxyethylthiazole kinase
VSGDLRRAERRLANPSNLIRFTPAEGDEMRGPDRPQASVIATKTPSARALVAVTADVFARLRTRSPRVHCITNNVAQNFTANALLAVGAIPAMTIAPDEIGAFVARADALLVNLGTFDAERRAAVDIAVEVAARHAKPWVLDPVFIDRSEQRAAYARTLLAKSPRAIRLNSAELIALGGGSGETSVSAFAQTNRTVVGLTGQIDLVADGTRTLRFENGHPWMGQVTAMGCAASALVAAALAVESDAGVATAAALLALGVAGEWAGTMAKGPGSFAVEIIDALHGLDGAMLERARVVG